jgi:hypothetical protein
MSSDPDVTRAVRSWLDEGADRLPERVLDSVLDAVPTTRQRRSAWPAWRMPAMSPVLRTGLVVALVALGLVAGVVALSAGSRAPAPATTPVPTAQAVASATPETPPAFLSTDMVGKPLAPGTWTVDVPLRKSMLVTIPEGFTLASLTEGKLELLGPQGGTIGVYLVDRVFADPCASTALTDVTTADQVVAAFASMAGFDRGLVSEAQVDGRRTQSFSLSNTIDTATAGCARSEMLPLFHVAGTGDEPATNGGTEQFVWVIDGKPRSSLGNRPWNGPILALADGWASDADLTTFQQIVASLNID